MGSNGNGPREQVAEALGEPHEHPLPPPGDVSGVAIVVQVVSALLVSLTAAVWAGVFGALFVIVYRWTLGVLGG